MSDTVISSIIGVAGAVVVAVATVVTQLFITKAVIRAERQKIDEQLRGEEASRQREKRQDRIIESISALLDASDPQSTGGVDYGKVANLITRVQLLLNLNISSDAALNGALNQLGLLLQEYVSVQHLSIDEKLMETKVLLEAHSNVIEHAKKVIKGNLTLAT